MLKMRLMYHTHGFVMAMHGMREPYKTTEKSDSRFNNRFEEVGPKDLELAKRLALAGPTHAKYRRMIQVWAEVTAPLYWWLRSDDYWVFVLGVSAEGGFSGDFCTTKGGVVIGFCI